MISSLPYQAWLEADRVTTSRPRAAVFGVARTACRLLADPAFDDELLECRARAYALLDEDRTDDEHLAALTEARAWSCDLAIRAATALVVAGGGRAMLRSNPAQRLLREAAFFAIQGQSGALRTATLARLRPSVSTRRT